MGFLKPHVLNFGAVAGVPPKRRPPEPAWVLDQEEDELERVRQADEVELRCRRERHGCVSGVEGAAEAGVGQARTRAWTRPGLGWAKRVASLAKSDTQRDTSKRVDDRE